MTPATDAPSGEIRLSVDGDGLVVRLSEIIESADERIVALNASASAPILFPNNDRRLSTLLEAGNRERIRKALELDYLVLAGELRKVIVEKEGDMTFFGGFFGAGYETRSATLDATILDLRTGNCVARFTADAQGRSWGVGLFYGVFVLADEKGSVESGIGHTIAETLASRAGEEKVRIVILTID